VRGSGASNLHAGSAVSLPPGSAGLRQDPEDVITLDLRRGTRLTASSPDVTNREAECLEKAIRGC
jgi:hypothetical protein